MSWFGLTLLSAFCLATADAITKRYLSGYRAGQMTLVRFGVTRITSYNVCYTKLLRDRVGSGEAEGRKQGQAEPGHWGIR